METKYLYSPSARGFYPRELQAEFIDAGNWPTDLLDVADEDYDRLMQSPSLGKLIAPDPNGHPTAEDAPSPSAEQVATRNTAIRDGLLAVAALRIAPLQDAADLGLATAQESTGLSAWKRYRVDVNRTDLKNPSWPSLPE